jgi:putative transposase
VQDSLNALLDKEANQIANAGRYERQACCSGHYRQNLTTTSRDVALSI